MFGTVLAITGLILLLLLVVASWRAWSRLQARRHYVSVQERRRIASDAAAVRAALNAQAFMVHRAMVGEALRRRGAGVQ